MARWARTLTQGSVGALWRDSITCVAPPSSQPVRCAIHIQGGFPALSQTHPIMGLCLLCNCKPNQAGSEAAITYGVHLFLCALVRSRVHLPVGPVILLKRF